MLGSGKKVNGQKYTWRERRARRPKKKERIKDFFRAESFCWQRKKTKGNDAIRVSELVFWAQSTTRDYIRYDTIRGKAEVEMQIEESAQLVS